MSHNELSESEIKSLTSGLTGPVGPPSTSLPVAASAQGGWDAQWQALFRRVMDCFAANAATELEGPTRASVSMEVACVDEISYGEFALALDNPNCVQLLEVTHFETPWVIELHPTVLFPVFDRLLGGGQLPAQIARRPLTDIECRLTGRITRLLSHQLQQAWQPMLQLELRSSHLTCNPRTLSSESPQQKMIVTRFDVAVGDSRGCVRLAVQRSGLVQLRDFLLAQPAERPPATNPELSVSLGQLQLSPQRIDQLQVGDLLITKTEVGTDAQVAINGQPRFRAKLGSFGGQKAVELTEPVVDAAPANHPQP